MEAPDSPDKCDVERLVSWPGFNSPLPKDYVDETFKYGVPPIHRCQSLSDMKRKLRGQEQKGYKKAKMQDTQDTTIDLTEEEEEVGPPGETEEGEVVDKKETVKTPIKPKMGSGSLLDVDAVEGTPIVEKFSPFSQLPQYSNFGVNMTEHIVFDNLPNYTGTWDKMTGIIQKIRDSKQEGD